MENKKFTCDDALRLLTELDTIGAQIGTCGEEFIEAVRKYYN